MKSYWFPLEATSHGSNGQTLYWYIVGRTLYLKGSGCVADFSEVGYSDEIDTIFIEDDVLIYEAAFGGDNHLRYLVIPADWKNRIVWEVPDDEWTLDEFFYDYPNLMVLAKDTEIEVVFASPHLAEAVIPDYATAIGTEFRHCHSLRKLIICDGIIHIPDFAFYCCTSLKSVILPDKLISVGRYAFAETGIDELIVPDTVTDIGEYAFKDIYNVIYHGNVPDKRKEYYDEGPYIHWHWGADNINAVPVHGELSGPELFFYFEKDLESVHFNFICRKVYICEKEKGSLAFADSPTKKAHACLVYKNDRWYVTAACKQSNVWFSGIRLKYGQEYLVYSGDQIMLKGINSFTVQCHPVKRLYRNRVEEMLGNLEQDIELYAKSQESDQTAFERIMDALIRVPLFCWGGYRPDSVAENKRSYIQTISVNYTGEEVLALEAVDRPNRESLFVPVFTSEGHAAKGDCQSEVFLYDFPLPVFNQIVKMDMDVVINPFSDYSVMISKAKVIELWSKIQELNKTQNCPAPDWCLR